jgi:hypothetical protein
MRYVGTRITQFDGSAYASVNCVAASTAALIEIVTVGRIRVSAASIRRASGESRAVGLSLTEAADAAVKLTGVVLEPRYLLADGSQRAKLQAIVAAGRPVAVTIDTNVTADTSYRTGGRTYTFRGRHEVPVAAVRAVPANGACQCSLGSAKPHGEYFVDDPGDQPDAGWRWWPADLLYRAAEKASGGGIWLLVGRDTEGVTRTARISAARFRMRPDITAPDAGKARLGRGYYVIQTTRGGAYKPGKVGWHQVKKRTGTTAWLRGDALA